MWQMLAGAALGGLSGAMGGGSKKETTTTEPWAKQAPYLERGFAGAGSALDAWNQQGPYTGQTYADMNGTSKLGYKMGTQFAQQGGAQLQNQYLQQGLGLMGQGGAGMSDIAGRMAGFNPTGTTDSILGAASQYANSPYMDSMVDAASRDVTRNLSEVQLPGINRSANGSGNLNSSRTGVAEGIAQRGAADRIGDISADLRGQAYQQGINTAQNQYQFNDNMSMSGLNGAGSLYGNMFNGGLQAGGAAQNQADANSGAFVNYGDALQANKQGNLNEAYNQYTQGRDYQFDGLDRYWGIVGSGNWGGTSTSQSSGGQSKGGSILQGVLGGAMKGYGMS